MITELASNYSAYSESESDAEFEAVKLIQEQV